MSGLYKPYHLGAYANNLQRKVLLGETVQFQLGTYKRLWGSGALPKSNYWTLSAKHIRHPKADAPKGMELQTVRRLPRPKSVQAARAAAATHMSLT
jgi:hypothetical protein